MGNVHIGGRTIRVAMENADCTHQPSSSCQCELFKVTEFNLSPSFPELNETSGVETLAVPSSPLEFSIDFTIDEWEYAQLVNVLFGPYDWEKEVEE